MQDMVKRRRFGSAVPAGFREQGFMFLQFPVELKGLSNGMIVQFQSKQYASVRLTTTFHGNASIYFWVYFLGLVGA